MKKILTTIAAITMSFNLDAIPIEKYKDYADKFSPETDLINGLILLNSNLLQTHRFFGPIKFYKKNEEKGDNLSCSFLDTSHDPMTNLLIQLFPSAGDSLNAQGTGSLYSMMEGKSVDIIVGMFAIAKDVRTNKEASEILKEINTIEANSLAGINPFVKKIFGFRAGKKVSERLFNIAKSIAYAVLSEEEPDKRMTNEYKKFHPYPPFYTNYLISAYVWQVLPASQLEDLAKKLSQRLGYSTSGYRSKLTEDIYADMMSYVSLVPFRPKESIISNGDTYYNGKKFQDCAETVVRQLICSFLCTSKDMPIGELKVDLTGIPLDSPLRNFFVTKTTFTDSNGVQQEKEEYKDIRDIANNGNSAVRDAWARVIDGHHEEGVLYNDIDHNMRSGWENLLKSICIVFKGYSAGTEPIGGTEDELNAYASRKEAADCIADLNREIEAKTFKMTPERVVESLQKIVKIRTDCKLIVENSEDSGLKQKPEQEVYGQIVIYPEGKSLGNELRFRSLRGHSKLLEIPEINSVNYSWIERLHYQDKVKLLEQDVLPSRRGKYPFFLNTGGANVLFGEKNLVFRYCPFEGGEDVEGIYRVLSKYCYDGSRFYEVISNIAEENMEFAKAICYCALRHPNSYMLTHAAFFLQKNGVPEAEINVALSAVNGLKRLVLKRLFQPSHYKEIDRGMIEYIKNFQQQNKITFDNIRYIIDLISDLNIKYADKQFKNRFRFLEPEILPLLIPYINYLTEELSKGSNFDISNSLMNLLNLINFRQEHPSLSEFKKAVKNYVSKYTSLFGLHKISMGFLNDKSLAKLDAILPMLTISNEEEASKVFKQLFATEAFDISLVGAVISDISREDQDKLIEKMSVISKEQLVDSIYSAFKAYSEKRSVNKIVKKVIEKIGGLDFNTAEAIMKRAIEDKVSYINELADAVLYNLKEGEQIPEAILPYINVADFICIKIIGKDLYDANSNISDEMAFLLRFLQLFLRKDGGKSLQMSKSSYHILEKMISKLTNKDKNKMAIGGATALKVGQHIYWQPRYNGRPILFKAIIDQFYRDMVKTNEDSLSEEEKLINQNYKEDFEHAKTHYTSLY